MSHADSMFDAIATEVANTSGFRPRTPIQDVRSIIAKAEQKIEAALIELSQALTPQDINVDLEKPAISLDGWMHVTKVYVRVTL